MTKLKLNIGFDGSYVLSHHPMHLAHDTDGGNYFLSSDVKFGVVDIQANDGGDKLFKSLKLKQHETAVLTITVTKRRVLKPGTKPKRKRVA